MITFFVFILSAAIQPSICFSEVELQPEKKNTLENMETKSGLEINMTESSGLGINKSYTSITQGQYIAGGLLGILPGFGIGHAVQGRWLEKGWIFTSSSLAAPLIVGGSALLSLSVCTWSNGENICGIIQLLAMKTIAGFIGLKIYEIIDIWHPPSHYKIVQEPKLSIKPLYSYNSQSSSYGLSLSYKW